MFHHIGSILQTSCVPIFFVFSTEEFSALMISLLIFQATMMPAKLTMLQVREAHRAVEMV